MKILSGRKRRPRRTMFYGQHGCGKSTWAAGAPSPIYIQCEDGLDDIGAERTELLTTVQEVDKAMDYLYRENHWFQSVVIDTIDWYEKMVWAYVCENHTPPVSSIEEIGYAKGYKFAIPIWTRLLRWLDCLRLERNMNVILLAHAKITKFQDPKSEGYDRYEPDLHKTVCPMLQEWCDEVLYGGQDVAVITKEVGFGKERHRAVDFDRRIIYTCEMPTHLAKRRIPMPDQIEMDWAAYQKCIDESYASIPEEPSANIAGIVKDGSSKTK